MQIKNLEEKMNGIFDDITRNMSDEELSFFSNSQPVLRLDDMSFNHHIRVALDGEGDVALTVVDTSNKKIASLEFCNSGGRSPKTYQALRLLLVAMMLDEKESVHSSDGSIEYK